MIFTLRSHPLIVSNWFKPKVKTNNKMKHNYLVFSGGGMAGFIYLGTIRYLQQESYYKDIKNISGSSVGSIFATAFALNIPIDDFERDIKYELKDEENKIFKMNIKFSEDPYHFGFDSGDRFLNTIKPYVKDMTFMDLTKNYGKRLVICATQMKTMMPYYFSVDNSPDIKIIDAIQASIAIPMFIRPHKIKDEYYIDGGVTDNIPFGVFSEALNDDILIIHLFNKNHNIGDNPSLFSYMMSIANSYIINVSLNSLLKKKYKYYCTYSNYPISFLPFKFIKDGVKIEIDEEQIDKCVEVGYMETANFLENRNKNS